MCPDNLEIFILTYNRSSYLEGLLSCLAHQTVSGFKVIVLDNASTDDTALVASSFKRLGYEFRSNFKNIGGAGNFQLAQELSSKEYVMILHDDDLIHPAYVEDLIRLIEDCPAPPVLVGSKMVFTDNPESHFWKNLNSNKKVIFSESQREFATLLYGGFPLHFGSVIYKTSILKKINWNKDVYGKIADRPFLIDVAGHGSAFVFDYPYVQYRVHGDQDSSSKSSGPFYNELLALHSMYFSILGGNILTKGGRVFVRNIFSNLKNESLSIDVRLVKYCRTAVQKQAASYATLFLSVIFFLLQVPGNYLRKIIAKIL
jgi:glycosyltransferase involved in cell wall biosynthesis